jgi:hypothetical protein
VGRCAGGVSKGGEKVSAPLFKKFFVLGRSIPRGRFVVHTEPTFRDDAIEHDQAIIEFIEQAIREKLEREAVRK